jgi:hypothetical protein
MELSTKLCTARVARSENRVNRHQDKFDALVVWEDTAPVSAVCRNMHMELQVPVEITNGPVHVTKVRFVDASQRPE